MNILWEAVFVLVFLNTLAHTRHKIKRRYVTEDENGLELRRTKRTIYHALLQKKMKEKRNVEDGIDISQTNLINPKATSIRPSVKQQVQEIQVEIQLKHEWRNEMLNKTSPEYKLIAGNVIDAVANELVADFNFLSTIVSNMRKAKSKHNVLVELNIRFYKSEENPLLHFEGIVSKGWISGQAVDPTYFKVIGTINGNDEKSEWHYPKDVELRIVPAMKSPESHTQNKISIKNQKPSHYKEIRISIKLKQRYDIFLQDKTSPEFSELSGNVEQAIMKIFAHDSLYIDAHVLEFRESPEGRVIVGCVIQFKSEERFAIEKCQAMISGGDIDGMPVDDRYFVVNDLTETDNGKQISLGIAGSPPGKIPVPPPITKKHKPKPLRYKELRISIKLNRPWNNSFGDNHTKPFTIYSGTVEEAMDRGLIENPNYIDATVLEFLESPEKTTIANIAVRFHLEEKDSERKLRNLLKNGTLSGLPVDKTFFYIFSISETVRPTSTGVNPAAPSNQTVFVSIPKQHGEDKTSVETIVIKQPIENKPNILNKLQGLKPSTVATENMVAPVEGTPPAATKKKPPIMKESKPVGGTIPTKQPETTLFISEKPMSTLQKQPSTFNPYLPLDSSIYSNKPGSASPQPGQYYYPSANGVSVGYTNPSYLDSSQGKINTYPQGTYPVYVYPFAQTAKQSWYPQVATVTPTFNPYLSVDTTTLPSEETTTTGSVAEQQPITTSTPEIVGATSDSIQGSMTLEQSWHPYLSDKSSPIYRVLEQTVVAAIKDVYAQIENEEVIPEVIGFSEATVPISGVGNEVKVGVQFKVIFLPGHKAMASPLERAVAAKSVGGILIHPNSLILMAASLPNKPKKTSKPLTMCQEQRQYAESAAGGKVGGFLPQCKPNGKYKTVQCLALTGFCWCVSKQGIRIQGTEERYKEPNCEGIKLSGYILLPPHAPGSLLSGSCLTVSVQEMILCGGDINCHIPIVANKTFKNPIVDENGVKYELTAPRLKPGRYVVSAVLNVGWCRINSIKSKYLIHAGDFHTTTLHAIVVQEKTTNIKQDIEVEFMKPEETGIKLEGHVILDIKTAVTSLPEGSCLSIETKRLDVCAGSKCPHIPTSGNQTIRDLEISNNRIAYSIDLPEMEPGTYVISAVLHMGQCSEGDQSMMPGDYFNDAMHDFVISSETTEANKDINIVKLSDGTDGGIVVTGRVILPPEQPTLPEGSCITISSRKLIQCRQNNCKIPPVATKTIDDTEISGGSIPYSLLLPDATEGKYIISAVVNVGWCKTVDGKDWIKEGDYYNDKVHDFAIKNETVIEKNIKVTKFGPERPKPGITIHGRVMLPSNINQVFSSQSCLTIKAQEYKLCGREINCVNPLIAKETFHNIKLEENNIPYAIVLPNVGAGHYIISAVLNVDWCRDGMESSGEWIRSGDYHNDETHDFLIPEHADQIEKDIEIVQYINIATAQPSVSAAKPFFTSEAESNPPPISEKQVMTQLPVENVSTKTTTITPNNENTANTTFAPPVISPSNKIEVSTSMKPEVNANNIVTEIMPPPESDGLTTTPSEVFTTISPDTINGGFAVIQKPETDTIASTSSNKTQPTKALLNSTNDLVTLPEGLPKSCKEIRDAGIGNMDGQYIIEARHGCHISIICQNMEETHPREFLGGPSEDEWKYWHYAILIKISPQDKQNIPTGACLEHSENGKDLLKRILIAGSKQGNPISEWRTNISKLLSGRTKRSTLPSKTLATKAKTIYKDVKRRNLEVASSWGVL